MLSIIAAVAKNGVIGNKGKLPWHLSEDLKHFKEITMGHPIIMGRKTFQSIGHPLPGRENIVLSSDEDFQAEGITVIHSFAEEIEKYSDQKSFVIGGEKVYQLSLPLVDRLYLTLIDRDFEGDTYFPEIDWEKQFKIVEESPRQLSAKEEIPYRFVIAERTEPTH